MEKARVIIVEDNVRALEATARLITSHGHTVVEAATSHSEAVLAIVKLESGELAANAIVLDDRLGADGPRAQEIIAMITAINGLRQRIAIIGFSGDSMAAMDVDVDTNKNPIEVVNYLNAMPEPEPEPGII